MKLALNSNITPPGTFTVEGEIIVQNSYWLKWHHRVGEPEACLEIDPHLVEALDLNGYEIAKKQPTALEK